jgi:hypothetical protein
MSVKSSPSFSFHKTQLLCLLIFPSHLRNSDSLNLFIHGPLPKYLKLSRPLCASSSFQTATPQLQLSKATIQHDINVSGNDTPKITAGEDLTQEAINAAMQTSTNTPIAHRTFRCSSRGGLRPFPRASRQRPRQDLEVLYSQWSSRRYYIRQGPRSLFRLPCRHSLNSSYIQGAESSWLEILHHLLWH